MPGVKFGEDVKENWCDRFGDNWHVDYERELTHTQIPPDDFKIIKTKFGKYTQYKKDGLGNLVREW